MRIFCLVFRPIVLVCVCVYVYGETVQGLFSPAVSHTVFLTRKSTIFSSTATAFWQARV